MSLYKLVLVESTSWLSCNICFKVPLEITTVLTILLKRISNLGNCDDHCHFPNWIKPGIF